MLRRLTLKLPLGIKGRPTRNGRTYVIEGTPTRTGVFSFTLTAIDALGARFVKRYKIRVR